MCSKQKNQETCKGTGSNVIQNQKKNQSIKEDSQLPQVLELSDKREINGNYRTKNIINTEIQIFLHLYKEIHLFVGLTVDWTLLKKDQSLELKD